MNCEERKDLLLLYAADALDPAERAELRLHLASGCPRCAGALVEAEGVLGHLPLLLDPVEPPAAVREALLRRVGTNGRREGAPVARRSGPLEKWLRPALAAAAATLVTYLAVIGAVDRQQRELEARLADQAAQMRRLRESTQGLEERVRLLTGPAVQVVSLAGTGVQPDARGRIFWDRARRTWLFYAAGLEAMAPDRTYQLWFITPDQQKISAGTFDVGPTGEGALDVDVPPEITVAVAAVTDEPAGGSPQPTGSIHLAASLDSSS